MIENSIVIPNSSSSHSNASRRPTVIKSTLTVPRPAPLPVRKLLQRGVAIWMLLLSDLTDLVSVLVVAAHVTVSTCAALVLSQT